jgi:hypothetical protein
VLEVPFNSVAFSIKQGSAEPQRGVVRDSEAPIGGDIASRIGEIALDDPEQAGDLVPTRRV